MNYIQYIKDMGFTDLIVTAMIEMGYSQQEIADNMKITRQTVINIKKRSKQIKDMFKE